MQLNINILDHKAALFIEMLQSMDFVVSVETVDEELTLSEEEKALIDKRLEEYHANPEEATDWQTFREQINQKYGV